MDTRTEPREPPGFYGPPVLGVVLDTADFLFVSGWERFFARRAAQYQSTVFRTSLFQKTTVVMDHDAISNLFTSTPFRQDYGFGWAVPPRPLVGEVVPSIFETGALHDKPKAFYQMLLASRSADLPQVFDDLFDRYARRWAELGTFEWRDEIETFTIDFVFQWLLRVQVDTVKVRTIYNNLFTDIFWRITRFFPWSLHSRSLRYYEELIQQIEGSAGFKEIADLARECGLTDTSYLARQLAFLTGMNSYLGLQCLFKSIAGELGLRPAMRKDLLASATDAGRSWTAPQPAVDAFIMEVLRLHPPVSFIFGRAEADTTITSSSGIFRIAQGELVMGVIPAAHSDEAMFPRAAEFDPRRFGQPAQRAHLIWPRGVHDSTVQPNDRTCPGKDAALAIARGFCTSLLTKAEWTIDAPITWNRRWFNLNVAAPEGTLPVRFALRKP